MVGYLPVPWCYPQQFRIDLWPSKNRIPSLGTLRTTGTGLKKKSTFVAAMAALKWTRTSKTFKNKLKFAWADSSQQTDDETPIIDPFSMMKPALGPEWCTHEAVLLHTKGLVHVQCQFLRDRFANAGVVKMGTQQWDSAIQSICGWPCPKSWKAVLSCSLVLVKCFICFGGISKSLG